MKRLLQFTLPVVFLIVFSASAALAQGTPVGTWRTIDDNTGEPRSIVEIYEENGALSGRIVEILQVSDKAKRNSEGQVICTACEGARKDQPIKGMVILEGLEKDGDEWSGGIIIDPSSGKSYKAKMELESTNRLKVRGYIGVPLFGRSQIWQRMES